MMISTRFIEVSMNLEILKQKLAPILAKHALQVYSIRTKREFGEKIVEILIDTESMDIDLLEKIHLEFQASLAEDDLDPDYFLELSSLGLERPLKTKDEVQKAIGRYIYLASPQYKGYGTLITFEDDILSVEVNRKGRMTNINIPFDQASQLRTAIKF
jgi:ribosome maturation factor RimP